MATEVDEKAVAKGGAPPYYAANNDSDSDVQATERYEYEESRKLGVMGSAFIILNKMIGTGSECANVIPHHVVANASSLLHPVGNLCRHGLGGSELHSVDSRYVESSHILTTFARHS